MALINLLRKVRIEGQWKLLPVVRHKDAAGQVRHDLTRVMRAGQPVVVLEGAFYIEYREDGRRIRRAIGDHPREVKAALATQASVIALRAQGVDAGDAPQIRPRAQLQGKTIRAVVDAFVQTPPLGYRPKSYAKYRNALEGFAAWCVRERRTHAVQIGREEVTAFMASVVREQGLDTSTAVDKAVIVAKILRDAGAPIAMRRGDWPKVTERQPEVYRPEVLRKLFAAAAPIDYARYQTFLLTGMREQEVAHLAWDDFDPGRSTLRVRKKPGFDPKTYQERTLPAPALLVELLERHRRGQGNTEFYVFPTSRANRNKGCPGGQPDRHMLTKLKQLAQAAGLNCGRCQGRFAGRPASCAAKPICTEFGLHMFRHTYATTLLREGVDLKSLQLLLGHKDLASTEKYLRALEPEDLLAKINRTNLATRFV